MKRLLLSITRSGAPELRNSQDPLHRLGRMTEKFLISGLLTERDVKRLARLTRGGVVGPTAVYYAGLSAPVITASMALMSRQTLKMIGLTDYWQVLLSTLLAAFAGIAWYLIFIRWSYRHKFGRGTEVSIPTKVEASADGLTVIRGDIETRIGWGAVKRVVDLRKFIVVTIVGADALIIPNRWFAKDAAARSVFLAAIRAGQERASSNPQRRPIGTPAECCSS